jgi:hypothetical protein
MLARASLWVRALAQAFWRFLTGTGVGRVLGFISLPLAIVVVAMWETEYSPPLFDVQMHYNEDAWRGYPARGIVKGMQRLNVRWAAVSSTPNDGTAKLAAADQTRIVAMFVPYRNREDREHWLDNPGLIEWVRKELDLGNYQGIGEFHLYRGRVDLPVVHELAALAAERRLVLNVHGEADVIRELLSFAPGLRVLWAHAGLHTPAARVAELLEQHRNLWAELSHRADVAPDGQLAPEWRTLFERYPDRFMMGSGTYSNEFWSRYRHTLELNREWLLQLPPELGERIAYRNALDLFARP